MNVDLSIADSALERLHDRSISSPELIRLLAGHRLLPQIYRELLIDQAIAPIACTPEEIQAAVQQFCETNKITDPAVQQTWRSQQGIAAEQFEAVATRSLRLEKFKQATWGKQVESHFLTCKAQLDQVVYSLLRTKDFAIAQELFFRIQAGESSFADVARTYSEGPEAQTGGLLGPMALTQPHPALATRLQSAQAGDLLAPFRLGEWIVIVRLEQLIAARLDEPTSRTLLDQLFQTWLQDCVSQLMMSSPAAAIAALSL
jgi:parvulin-like peptidyl-prolyl isomerase